MAKLDELLEILAEEMVSLQGPIKQMKEISNSLNDSEVQRAISQIQYKQDQLEKEQQGYFNQQERTLEEVHQKVKRAKLIPKWLIILCSITFFSAFIISAYAIYEVRDSWDKQVEAYRKGKQEIKEDYDTFFLENKRSYGQYLKWQEQQEEIEKGL